ncbi:MAG: hypothetical protein DRJ38_09570 [Thermoprotei archaeon]|nr:MAG: hypothetical protein DRJ38_09570 [Thermoprotei archaeon]
MSVIRIRAGVKDRLERLKRKTGVKSMSELIAILVEIGEKELDRFEGNIEALSKSLKFAGEAGRRDSERIDELLYGDSSGYTN